MDIEHSCKNGYENVSRNTDRIGFLKRSILKAIDQATEIAAETLWPTRCAVCDKPGEVLCSECRSHLVMIDSNKACPRCGAPYGTIQCSECDDMVMGLQKRKTFPITELKSAVVIDEKSKRIITAFKDHDEHRLCSIIASYMARYIDPDWIRGTCNPPAKSITFIPSTKEAVTRRGFDHAELIAENIADISKLFLLRTFERPRSLDQRKLGRAQRTDNMKSEFIVRSGIRVPKSIILIDDIATTGATIYSAADSLAEAGCECVFGLTFGKVLD